MLTILTFLIMTSVRFIPHASAKELKAWLAARQPVTQSQPAASPPPPPPFSSDMNGVIKADPDGLSVAATLIDLDSNQQYDAGATTKIFKAASTAKVLAAVDYLHQVEE